MSRWLREAMGRVGSVDQVVGRWGTKRVRWLEENFGALPVELTEGDVATLDPLADQVVGGQYG